MPLVKIGITFSLIERISTEIKRDKTSIIVVVPCPQFLRMLEHGSVTESALQTATNTKNRVETSIMEETTTHTSMFVRCVQMEGLLSVIIDAIMVSWRPSKKAAGNRPVEKWLKYCGRWDYHPNITL